MSSYDFDEFLPNFETVFSDFIEPMFIFPWFKSSEKFPGYEKVERGECDLEIIFKGKTLYGRRARNTKKIILSEPFEGRKWLFPDDLFIWSRMFDR